MRMRRITAKRGAARVPAKMVQLVARVWKFYATDFGRVGSRRRVCIHNRERVGRSFSVRAEQRDVCERLRWSFHRVLGRSVKRGVWFEEHGARPFSASSRGSIAGEGGYLDAPAFEPLNRLGQ